MNSENRYRVSIKTLTLHKNSVHIIRVRFSYKVQIIFNILDLFYPRIDIK
ncbi:MAG: hypothetical protein ACI8SK_001271 [Shewanella sp.]|jgi:hypothetical protein